LYDEELRRIGLRTTQFSLLAYLSRVGEVRQSNLGELMLLEETTVSRNLRPLINAGWVAVRDGTDRREKLVTITAAGTETFKRALPVWVEAQTKMKSLLSDKLWKTLLDVLPEVAKASVKK
jgi:DNA-binding MarR family transcriptional regulator